MDEGLIFRLRQGLRDDELPSCLLGTYAVENRGTTGGATLGDWTEAPMNAAALAALDRESYINLATFRRDGRAVETPVWFAAHDGHLYAFSEARAGKMKRLRNGSALRVAACNLRGVVHGEWIEGEGRRVDDPGTIETAYAALLAKYGWQMRMTNWVSRLAGRIDARAVIEIDLADG